MLGRDLFDSGDGIKGMRKKEGKFWNEGNKKGKKEGKKKGKKERRKERRKEEGKTERRKEAKGNTI